MKLLKDMKIFDTVKLKENGVPVEYIVMYKITPEITRSMVILLEQGFVVKNPILFLIERH